jgi:hypothetical protein
MGVEFALLIYSSEEEASKASPELVQEVMHEYWTYEAWLDEARIKQVSKALNGASQAATVRDGLAQRQDGPFSRRQEQLGGFYVLECDGLVAAVEAATRWRGAEAMRQTFTTH